MRTSSGVRRAGAPSAGGVALRTITTRGRRPSERRGLRVGVHPRAAALAVARERVDVQLAAVGAVRVRDAPDAHVGMRAREVVARGERRGRRGRSRPRTGRRARGVEREVLLQARLVDRMPVAALARGVVRPVPRLERARVPVGVERRLVARALRACCRGRGGADLAQHVHDRRDRAGGLLVELELRMGGEAEEPGPLGAQRRDLADDGAVVVRAAAPAARHRRVDAPARAARDRADARAPAAPTGAQTEDVAVDVVLARGARRRLDHGARESVELGRVADPHREGRGLLAEVARGTSASRVESRSLIARRRAWRSASSVAPARTRSRW